MISSRSYRVRLYLRNRERAANRMYPTFKYLIWGDGLRSRIGHVLLTSSGSEKSGSSGTKTPTRAQTTMSRVHMPRTTTGQSASSAA